MKTLMLSFLAALALAPAAALASGPSNDATTSARADCTALRASMGASFDQAYASFGACVSHYAPIAQKSLDSANATCSTQQADANFAAAHSGKTFAQFYGTGKSDKNAFGNCVSTTAKTSAQTERQNRLNPAQTCRASRTQMGAATFASTYGKNASDKNAFGKCVSATAKAQSQNESSASDTCRAEQNDTSFAAAHNGQTFEQVYGSFGGCVSSKAKAASTSQQQATVSAAKQCSAEQKAGASAFTAKYGTFGHCVSAKAKA